MKTKSFILSLVCFVSLSLNAQDTIRIMTFNVAAGLMADMQQLGQYIKDHNVDMVALQEVDLRTNRPETPQQKGKNQMVELGFYSDLLPVFGQINRYPTGGFYGLGFLSKDPILSITNVPLPQVVDKKEPRSMVVASWEVNGKKITIANTHLSLDEKNREVQMKFIKKYMKRIQGVKFVMGDLNSKPEEGLVTKIFTKWIDALPAGQNTFSSWNPIYKYDYMLYDEKCAIEVINAQVDTPRLSDHYPCFIDIVLH
jgi:endonuclease/exonuclease/phosphatase family metal-dependent hydrolase